MDIHPKPATKTSRDFRRSVTAAIVASVLALTMTACGSNDDPAASANNDTSTKDDAADWAADTLAKMTLDEKIGQLFVTYVYGETADTTNPDDVSRNQDLFGVDNGTQLLDQYQLGGVIYFDWSNSLTQPEQILTLSNGLQDSALAQPSSVPLLISTDQEQGIVTRVGPPITQFPGSMAVAASSDTKNATTAASITGSELRALGINQDFAPVADVNMDPDNPVIGVRSFSSDPVMTAEFTTAAIDGFQGGEYPVAATAKHFPGHGDTATDSHTSLPMIDHTKQEWKQWDAPPFNAAIDAGVDAIMTAHIQFPALDPSGDPATLSNPIVTGLLREDMGYDGVVVTDSLAMAGVNELYSLEEVPVKAIQAGADMLLMPPDLPLAFNAVKTAVDTEDISVDRIDESVTRILKLKYQRGVVDNPHADAELLDELVGTEANQQAASDIAAVGTTLVANDRKVLPLADTSNILVTGVGSASVSTMAATLSGHGANTTELPLGTDPDRTHISQAVDAAKTVDATVVLTKNVTAGSTQVALLEALRDTGTPVIIVAIENPYDINQFAWADSYLVTYSSKSGAISAAGDTIYGATKPRGTLPVDIPSATESGTNLYKIGHGLHY